MKKLFFLLVLLILSGYGFAQDKDSVESRNVSIDSGNSLVKLNLLSLPLRNFSLAYEHKIGRKVTAGLGLRIMPKGGLPMRSSISNLIDDPDTDRQLDNFKTGNVAFTPEIRFYMGKQAMRGFYLAPFARISSYTAEMPFEFDVNGVTQTMPLSGKLNTFTGGLLLGAQWKLGGKVYLDWWMLGPQYGSSNGLLDGKKALNAQEQQELRNELQDIEIPFAETTTTVDANGARLDIKGPWAGLRAGLCLGIRF
ncbi:MAG: DUF3575 domain-containing protein [Daejeonella sp.]|uniref:DUF3575 domain-containing protein n=1 Tax=Daejeonella sp. TaxID=2805397 RepID=UPI00273568C6|nr:DUF3575 domain-containing protein [Daejeonella sp.]MDP3469472.1 DUF3575 domain-containing protein [Daejeonella sp.]